MAHDADNKKRPTFDPTINLGHILTFIGFMATGMATYSTLDKRLAVVEIRQASSDQSSIERETRMKESLNELKMDVKEVKQSINLLIRKQ